MNSRRLSYIYAGLAVVLVVALALLVPNVTAATPSPGGPGGGGEGTARAKTGICVTGQVIDADHVGVPGMKVTGQGGEKQAVEATSDADGMFRFDDVAPGEWTFAVAVPQSWQAVTAASFPVTLEYGQEGCYEIRFKLAPQGCIVVTKQQKLAGKEGAEQFAPLEGWPVQVTGPRDAEGKTDANGRVRFDNLTPGNYTVSEVVSYTWRSLTDPSVDVQVKPSNGKDDCAQVKFQNEQQPTTCIDGTKVDDQHNPVAGWSIFTQQADGSGPTFEAVTGEDGTFHFPDLVLGEWTVWEDMQPGWTPITSPEFNVTLEEAGDKCVQVRFKNQPPEQKGCIEGFKRDDTKTGLPGWKIWIQRQNGGSLMQATTDGTGKFRFEDLRMGYYDVWEEMQPGWQPLSPTKLTIGLFPPADGSDQTGCAIVSFTNKQKPKDICIDGFKLDTHGGVGLPGFTITATLQSGDWTNSAVTDGLGYFRFGNLLPGTYRLTVGEKDGWAPVGPSSLRVTVDWPPTLDCTRVKFWDRQDATTAYVPPDLEQTEAEVYASPEDQAGGGTCQMWHTVRPGNTIGNLGVYYGVSSRALLRANNIPDPDMIYVGQKLCIPGR